MSLAERIEREILVEEGAASASHGSVEYQKGSEWTARYAAELRRYNSEEIDAELRDLDAEEEQDFHIERMREREAQYQLKQEGHAPDVLLGLVAALRVEHSERLEKISREHEPRRRELTYFRRKADEVVICGGGYERPHARSCPGGVRIIQVLSCDDRGCRKCGPRKVWDRIDRYGRRLAAFFEVNPTGHACYSFTLTTVNLRSGTDGLPTQQDVDCALKALSRFCSRTFRSGLRTAIFAMEIAPDFGMIHFHGFVVAEARLPFRPWPLNKDALEVDWARICNYYGVEGGGGFSDIKQVQRGEERAALGHVLKYVSKPYSVDPERAARIRVSISKNTRIIRTFGWFHGNTRPTLRQAEIAGNAVGVEDADEIDRAVLACEKRPEITVIREVEVRLKAEEPPKLNPNECPCCHGRLLGIDTSRFYTRQDWILLGFVTPQEYLAEIGLGRAPPLS